MVAVELRRAVYRWLADGKAQGWSPKTLQDRRETMERVSWWLEHEEGIPATVDALDPSRIRSFLAYARDANPKGRFGSNRASAKREARPATVSAYFRCLRALSNFCLEEGLMRETPLRNVKAPRVPVDQVQPLAPEQVQALVDAARRSRAPERDVAILMLLVDTGMRCSELAGLRVGNVDRGTGELTVTGKGNKLRTVYMGVAARRALWRYLESEGRREASRSTWAGSPPHQNARITHSARSAALWRSQYPHWFFYQALLKILGIGVERNLLGVPVGKQGDGAQDDDRQSVLTTLRRLRAAEDAAITLPPGWNLEWFESQRNLMDAMPFLHHHNAMMAQVGLAQFLSLGQSTTGTQALAKEHTEIFQLAEEGRAVWIEETLNRQLVRRWCRVNYGEGLRPPLLRHRKIAARDLGAWTAALNSLVQGEFLHPGKDDEEFIRDAMELPPST